ncbi:MAG TPA: FtsQ-type POTRA domain-containing protein [Firmicutes bacterium]|nr:FtsQ-type POTRA domain-containing protein [Candidatus Fermentithermobacillaceae bacterium]
MKRKRASTSGRATKQSRGSEEAKIEETGRGSPWALVIVFFLLTGVFLFLRSPFFSVRNYVITGASRVSHAEIIARSSQRSTNIFDVDLDKAQKTIEASPWIKAARCTRKFPDTIVIDIDERRPIMFAPVGGKMWLIDEQGRVLQEDDGVFDDLIAFTGIQDVLAPGQFLKPQYDWGLKIVARLGPVSQNRVIELNVEDRECILILDDGCKVFMGEDEPGSEARIELLESIVVELEEEGKLAEYIDLRFDKHAVKLKL